MLLDTRRRYTRLVPREVQASAGGVYDLGYHLVWCPKYRRPVLTGQVRVRLEELLRAKADEHGWRVVALEIEPDHVHLFVKAHPSDSPSYVANQLKGFSSHMLRGEFLTLRSRLPTLWSRSFFVATVGAVSAATVKRYIDTRYERPWREGHQR